MQHILFSIVTAFIGINLIAVQALEEQGKVEFTELGVTAIEAKEETPTPFQLIPFIKDAIPQTKEEERVSSVDIKSEQKDEKRQEKGEEESRGGYNVQSEKEVSASGQGIENGKALIPLSPTPTIAPTEIPSATPSATPTPPIIITDEPIIIDPIVSPCPPINTKANEANKSVIIDCLH